LVCLLVYSTYTLCVTLLSTSDLIITPNYTNLVLFAHIAIDTVAEVTWKHCVKVSEYISNPQSQYFFLATFLYRGADKSLARPASRCILFDGENISFDASLVIYINSTNIPPILIINRIYGNQNLLSL